MTQKRKPARKRLSVECLEDRLCPSSLPLATPLTQSDAATQAQVSQAYGQLPLSFEANQGQVDAQVNFLSRGSGYTLFLTPGEAVLSLQKQNPPGADALGSPGDALRMQLVGANAAPQVVGLDALPGRSNYLIGNDPSQWHTDVPSYARIAYQNVYSGVDLVYYGNQRQLEYDFLVAPGADPHTIKLAFQGAESMAIDAQGNLILHTAGGDVIEHAPVLYQESAGVRQAVSGRYVIEGNGQVGFALGAYDPSRQLVIDPVYSLVYSTYLGGSATDYAFGIAVDDSGSAYVTGFTSSSNFPTQNPLQRQHSGITDAFVTKLNAAGSALVYSTYLGGSGEESGHGIAVSGGSAYVTGYTSSTNFPTKNAFQTTLGGGYDAFVTKLNARGSALVYSSYIGGSGTDKYYGADSLAGRIAVDGAGNAYVAGYTESTNFPTKNPFQATGGGGHLLGDAFVTKIDPSQVGAASLVYSTYLGGSALEVGYDITVDSAGDAYVTGLSRSTNFPVTPGAFQVTGNITGAAFVTKFSATGSALVYSTMLDGPVDIQLNNTKAFGIAVNSSGNAYVTGYTTGPNFPTTLGAYQTARNGGSHDAFVTEFNLDGSALVYSTYLGGTGRDRALAIALDGTGNAYVTGFTFSTDFPTANAFQPTFGGFDDAFVTELSANGAALVYSTYLGGSGDDEGFGIAVDVGGNAYVTGLTGSANFPTTTGAFQTTKAGSSYSDAFVTKIDPPAVPASTVASSLTPERTRGTSPVSLGGPAAIFVASSSTSAPVASSARDAVAALLALPIDETGHQANPSIRAPLAETRAESESSSARGAPRDEAIAATLVSHIGHRLKATSVRIEVTDAVFARGDWLPHALMSDEALVSIG